MSERAVARTPWRFIGVGAVAALLSSCGGGGSSSDTPIAAAAAPAPAESLAKAQAFIPPLPIPADAHLKGMWSEPYAWPVIAVHQVLLPDGRLLSFGTDINGKQGASSVYDIWDNVGAPNAGHLTIPNTPQAEIFCSSALLIPPLDPTTPAAVTIAGGDVVDQSTGDTTNLPNNNSAVIDVATGTITRTANMKRARWYSSSTTLPSGEIYIQGGNGGTDRPEIRSTSGAFRLLDTAYTGAAEFYYPRNFVAPDGRVFGLDTTGKMYYVDTTGTGNVTSVGTLPAQYTRNTSSIAMFRPGRMLQFGGNSNGAVIIDITGGGTPVVTPTQSMSSQRQWVNGTLLADGRVLATGGAQGDNTLVGVNNKAEIWDPTTGQWTLGAEAAKARLYHSSAILLPDASVLVGGSGASTPTVGGPSSQRNVEIYYPPYLFTATGQRAPRPTINSAPDWFDIGKTYQVTVGNATAVSRVTFVRTGAVTHSFNMEQRFLDATFTRSGNTLSVQAPSRAADAPPGYYQLFVFDGNGVPSVAKIIRIGVAPMTNPATTPTVTSPGAQSGIVGSAVNLGVPASDPNGDPLSFSATGLPPGLAISAAGGVITGTPTTAGSFNVVVTVSDGVNTASTSFVWTLTGTSTVVIDPLPPPNNSVAGSTVSFSATASGGTNTRFAWNFGDGTPDSAWSPSGNATHTYAAAGTFSVTLKVTDDSSNLQSRTFLQTIYLPPTPGKPTASSNLVIETPAGGNPRLWVVNQDNDSITGFDTVTRAKLGEVAVGEAPRSIAVSAAGQLWVTNKRSATISIISPATRAIVGTITLPRASQPFGITMSPNGAQAYVALEATGQVVRIDTTSRAIAATASVGAHPRHLSVSADGAKLYATRFITPPLPGEGTAVVSTGAGNGAQVLVLDGTSLAVQKTIVLAHSNKVDAENEGRGIPNYLGAAVISPDGTQAYVPSKQDNIARGALRDGTGLNFQSTVRAISSRIALASGTEDLARRVDHDNASVASAAVFDPQGVYLFVALETSREVAVVAAHSGTQVMRIDVGRAPQGLALSADGTQLFVNNFMDRTVSVFDVAPLLRQGQLSAPIVANLAAVGVEKLAANVLVGKQFFYDARDVRLSRDRYMSCASCHNDGGSDGRTWDFTGQGEGLRNTSSLRGRTGAQGKLHWSANFDEVQDFEAQIRSLSGGSGLMPDAVFNTGTRNQPLGDPKAGLSADLDALAAYVTSLETFDQTPHRTAAGDLTSAAIAGRTLFTSKACIACHGGASYTNAATATPPNIGTIKASSGQRLGGPLTGIDIPTLRDVWAQAPYLHDGSAATLEAAVAAHNNVTTTAAERTSLAEFLRQIGSEEPVIVGSGSITAAAAAGTAVNLSTEGTLDWAHWGENGAPGLVRKTAGNSQISSYTVLNAGTVAAYANDPRDFSWTDGAPIATGTARKTGVWTGGVGRGFAITVPADTQTRTVKLHVGGWNSSGTLRAQLSDGSAAEYVDTTAVVTGQYTRTYTITYRAGLAAQTLTLSWTHAAGAGGNVTLNAATLVGTATNRAPVLVAPAPQTGTQGVATTLALSATDADGDAIAYAATGLPPGLVISTTTGLINGTPTTAGSYTVSVAAADSKGASDANTFAWTILPPNRPPVITTPAAQTSLINQSTSLAITASDPDAEAITFSATGLPPGLGINSLNGIISGTPTTAGNYSARVTVADSRGGNASATFAWAVQATAGNRAPVVTTPAAQTSVLGQAAAFTIVASDPDADPLAYAATGLPPGLAIGAATGAITGTPTTAGSYAPVVTITDGKGGSTPVTFAWTVQPAGGGTGALAGSVDGSNATVDLSAQGTADWTMYGQSQTTPGLVRKAGVAAQISAYAAIGAGPYAAYNNDPRVINYTGGTPALVPTARGGVYVAGQGKGFAITVPADTQSRTVKAYVGGYFSSGTFRATLSDGSAADFTETTATATGQYDRTYTITYRAASAGQTLQLSWVQASSGGNVTLNAIALAGAASTPSTTGLMGVVDSSNTTASLSTLGSADWVAYGQASAVPGIVRKPNVAALITPYTAVGTGTYRAYANDPRTLSYSSATTTTNTRHGIYVGGTGNGYTFTVPADTQLRVLSVFVGGYYSSGTFTASLSDGSSPDYVDAIATPQTGQYDRSYVITYRAASAGQMLRIRWVQTGASQSSGNVTLNGIALSAATAGANAAPAATAPAAQTSNIGQAVNLALAASDGDGDTLAFAATGLPPGLAIGAASGMITGTPTTAGNYTPVVTVTDGRGSSTPVTFAWSITPVAGTASLIGSVVATPTAADLTTLGTIDWAHWGVTGVPGLVRKESGGARISGYTVVGAGTVTAYNNDPRGLTWNDGAPIMTGTASARGVYIIGAGNGFTWTVPADTSARTVRVYVGGWNSSATLRAELSDGSAPAYTDTTAASSSQYDRSYTITYRAGSPGQTLRLTWVQAAGSGNVALNGSTLSP